MRQLTYRISGQTFNTFWSSRISGGHDRVVRGIGQLRAERDPFGRVADGRDVAPRGARRRPRRLHRPPGRALQLGEGLPQGAREDDQVQMHVKYSNLKM